MALYRNHSGLGKVDDHSMTGEVKIIQGEDPWDTKVWLNGHELQGLCSLQVNIAAQELPTVTFTIEPAMIEFEGLVELKRVFEKPVVPIEDLAP